MSNSRAMRAIQNARPIVRTVLTTTAIAWSFGALLPAPAPKPTVLAQSIGLSAPNPATAVVVSSRLVGPSSAVSPSSARRPSSAEGSPRPA